MKNSENLLIGGSIIGGLAAIFGFYHAFVERTETDEEGLKRSQLEYNKRFSGGKKKQSRKRRSKSNKK